MRRKKILALLAFVGMAAALAGHATFSEWIPPGPFADASGYAPGSDWDKRWQTGLAGEAAQTLGRLPYWDPHLNFGTPLWSEPESPLLHPAWRVGARLGGARGGWSALYTFTLFAMFLSYGWLGRKLEVPFPLAMAAGLVVLATPEWVSRQGAGHIGAFGIALWPALLAAALEITDDRRVDPRLFPAALYGVAAGAVLGLIALGGGHYPLPYGLFAFCLALWAGPAPRGACAALCIAFALPLAVGPDANPAIRWVFEALALGAIGWGVWSGGRARAQLAGLFGAAAGLLSVAGAFLVPAAVRGADARSFLLFDPPHLGQALDLRAVVDGPSFDQDGVLMGASLGMLVAIGLVLAVFAFRSRGPGTAALVMGLAGLGTGLPTRPWLLIASVPGMSAAVFQYRLQWALLIVAPIAAAALLCAVLKRLGGARGLWVGAIVVAAVVILRPDENPLRESPGAPASERLPPLAGRPLRVESPIQSDGDELDMSSTILRRSIRPELRSPDEPQAFRWPEGTDGLAVVHRGGMVEPQPSNLMVEVEMDEWRVTAPPGTVVALPQRDFPGWRCEGGETTVDEELAGRPEPGFPDWERRVGEGEWWLTVAVGATGVAVCSWRPPLLGLGIALQGGLLFGVLGIAAWGIRRRSAASAARARAGAVGPV